LRKGLVLVIPLLGRTGVVKCASHPWESGLHILLLGCPSTQEWAKEGFTSLWLPPPSDSVSPQGYLPRDLYVLDSQYGKESELREFIQVAHEHNFKVIADIVINHRCVLGKDCAYIKVIGMRHWGLLLYL
jgi:hypothetical protein